MTYRRLPPLPPRRQSKPRLSSGVRAWPAARLQKFPVKSELWRSDVSRRGNPTHPFCFSSSPVRPSAPPWPETSCPASRRVWTASLCCGTSPAAQQRQWLVKRRLTEPKSKFGFQAHHLRVLNLRLLLLFLLFFLFLLLLLFFLLLRSLQLLLDFKPSEKQNQTEICRRPPVQT